MAVMVVTVAMGTTVMGVMAITTILMDLVTMVSIRLVTVLHDHTIVIKSFA